MFKLNIFLKKRSRTYYMQFLERLKGFWIYDKDN